MLLCLLHDQARTTDVDVHCDRFKYSRYKAKEAQRTLTSKVIQLKVFNLVIFGNACIMHGSVQLEVFTERRFASFQQILADRFG